MSSRASRPRLPPTRNVFWTAKSLWLRASSRRDGALAARVEPVGRERLDVDGGGAAGGQRNAGHLPGVGDAALGQRVRTERDVVVRQRVLAGQLELVRVIAGLAGTKPWVVPGARDWPAHVQ